mmetsp:Transcript_38013/g.104552  ORF Transcript_38013/g.104552 Transcript_38013/m.104552 type:complete len:458 (+) Transcript_38013:116-1489(+)
MDVGTRRAPEDAEDACQLRPGRPVSPLSKQETLLIFDWDDTILPTSWLERVHALSGAPLRPEVQRQIAGLCSVAAQTISFAMTMGTVIIITNSAPGWVDQSCQLFMPQIHQQVRGLQICSKPMHAPLTFKITSFRRECRQYRNILSIGDGDAERAASLRLQAAAPSGADQGDGPRHIKSVKLVDLPTCQQLVAQHEMLQVRLADVVACQGGLDLKARFPPVGLSFSNTGAKGGGNCTLVHFVRRAADGPLSQSPALQASPQRVSAHAPMQEDGATAASGRMQGLLRSVPTQATQRVNSPFPGAQLPPLGRSQGGRDADLEFGRGSGTQTPSLTGPSGSSSAPVPAVGERPSPSLVAGGFGSGSTASLTGAEAVQAEEATVGDDQTHNIAASSPAAARGSDAATSNLWKVQTAAERSPGRSLYHNGGKKRPVLVTGIGTRGAGAVWRDHSAPAAPRGF